MHQRLIAVNVTEATAIPELDELRLFRIREPGDAPPPEAGAAMLALIAQRQFPTWALTFYDALKNSAGDTPPPTLALVATDAILLAPRFTPQGWRGFLIAEESAAGQARCFHPPDQPEASAWLAVPVAPQPGAVWAAAAASLPILPPPVDTD